MDIEKIRDAAEPGVRPEGAQAAGAGGARGVVAQSPTAPAQTGAGATQAFAAAPGFDPVAAARMLEEALEVERGLLRTMIDSLPNKIYAKDTQSRFIACNWPVAREMGTTPSEIIGRTDFDYFPAEMAEGFFADEQAVIRSGEPLIDREEQIGRAHV